MATGHSHHFDPRIFKSRMFDVYDDVVVEAKNSHEDSSKDTRMLNALP
jgi:hypothetical protein